MRNRVWYLVLMVLSLTAILGFPPPGLADSSSMSRTPDGVYPVFDSSVTMSDEYVRVILDRQRSFAQVDCRFTFKNDGGPREVLMGFPACEKIEGMAMETMPDGMLEEVRIHDFRAYVGGKEVEVREDKAVKPSGINFPPGTDYYSWYTFTVPMGAGETKEVRNTYRVHLRQGNYTSSTGYILTTGAFWKGPIGHARVDFILGDVKPYEINRLFPYGFRFAGNDLVFERYDFEPRYDLGVGFFNRDALTDLMPEEAARIRARKKRFEAVEAAVKTMDVSQLRGEYRAALAGREPIIAAYMIK